MKKRLDALEAKLMSSFPTVDGIDWTKAPQDVLDALEVMEALAATLPAGLSAAEKYGQVGLMPEGFAACRTVSKWVSHQIGTEPKRALTSENVCIQ